jgi:hypothetical protein
VEGDGAPHINRSVEGEAVQDFDDRFSLACCQIASRRVRRSRIRRRGASKTWQASHDRSSFAFAFHAQAAAISLKAGITPGK